MRITFFSFFISIMWSSVLIAILLLCRRTHIFNRQFGVADWFVLYVFSAARMALPLEFTFTIGVPFRGLFSDFYEKIKIDTIGISQMSVMEILLGVWMTVSAVLLIRFICQYLRAVKRVSFYAVWKDKQCQDMFEQVIHDSKTQMKIDIRCSRDVQVPMGIGIFRKSIILPDQEYSGQELYYILLHEYTHFLNGDLSVKMFMHIFCCVFWWNPMAYLLKKDLDQVLEIKCDLCVTEKMDHGGKINYLTTIVSVLRKADTKKSFFYGTAGLASNGRDKEVVERFKIVAENHGLKSKNKKLAVLCFSICCIFYIGSYSCVIVPHYETPIEEIEIEPGIQAVTGDNSYIIKDKNGAYRIVMPDGERQTIDEKIALDMLSQGFHIIEEE